MVEESKLNSDVVRQTDGSLYAADKSLDEILQSICQKKWEQEVIEKKGKPHSVHWVFSQAQECYFQKPDPNKVTT